MSAWIAKQAITKRVEGAAECVECAINFYSETDATECIACPSGKTTNGLKGSAVCSDPVDTSGASELDLKSREGVINLFKSGMAYMITIILSIAFAVFGYFIMAGRMKNPRLCVLAPPMVLANGHGCLELDIRDILPGHLLRRRTH